MRRHRQPILTCVKCGERVHPYPPHHCDKPDTRPDPWAEPKTNEDNE